MPEDDEARRRDVQRRLAVALQAFVHIVQDDVGATRARRLGGILGEREVVRRHIAGDLVDRLDEVVAELLRSARGPSPRSGAS